MKKETQRITAVAEKVKALRRVRSKTGRPIFYQTMSSGYGARLTFIPWIFIRYSLNSAISLIRSISPGLLRPS
jgi:hypothetical protein